MTVINCRRGREGGFTTSIITSAARLLSILHICLKKKQKCLISEDVIRTIVRTMKMIA